MKSKPNTETAVSPDPTVVIGEHDWLDPVELMLRSISGWLSIGAVAAVIAGFALLVAPELSMIGLTRILGAYFVVTGAGVCFYTYRHRDDVEGWPRQIALGAVMLVGGLAIVALPDASLRVVAVILGAVLITTGSGELLLSGLLRSVLPGWRVLGWVGLASVLAGAFAVLWPDTTMDVLTVVIGLYLVSVGVALLLVRHRLRGTLKRLAQGRPAASVGGSHVIDLRDTTAPLRRMSSEWDIPWAGSDHWRGSDQEDSDRHSSDAASQPES